MIDSDQNELDDLEIDEGSLEAEELEEGQEESPEESSEEAESSEESQGSEQVKPVKAGYVEIKDPAVKARVDELTRKMHENARRAEAAERKLQQQQKEPEPPKEVPAPSADPLIDPDVYANQMRAREQYIRDQMRFESESEQRKQQREVLEQEKQGSLLTTYNKNIERLKINPQDLKVAADTVTQYGISKDLTEFLLEDDDGPAIVKFLHQNVDVLADVVGMSPAKAVSFIERSIRNKLNVKPISKAPSPPTRVNGSRPISSSTDSDGTTYE